MTLASKKSSCLRLAIGICIEIAPYMLRIAQDRQKQYRRNPEPRPHVFQRQGSALSHPAPLLVPRTCPLGNFFNFILSTFLAFAAMADININQETTQPTGINAPAPTAEAEVQENVLPPWANGSEPSVPVVDNVDDHVRLDVYGISTLQNPCAELRWTEYR